MLTSQDRTELEEAILEFIGMEVDPTRVRLLIGSDGRDRMGRVTQPAASARWILDYSLGLPQPDVFIKLVRMADLAEAMVELRAFAAKLEGDVSLWRPPWLADMLYVPADSPFLDRHQLRTALRAVAGGQGAAAMTVEAPTGFGKRTLCAYIKQTATDSGTYRPFIFELRREPDPGRMDYLVDELRFELGLPAAANTTHAEPEKRGEILARELSEAAKLAANTVWLVVNVIDPDGVEPEVLKFLDALLDCVQNNTSTARRLRILVLSDDLSRLPLTKLPGIQARFALPDVAAAEITEWFAAVVPGKPSDLYSTATSEVLQVLQTKSPPPSRKLSFLNLACRKTLIQLREA